MPFSYATRVRVSTPDEKRQSVANHEAKSHPSTAGGGLPSHSPNQPRKQRTANRGTAIHTETTFPTNRIHRTPPCLSLLVLEVDYFVMRFTSAAVAAFLLSVGVDAFTQNKPSASTGKSRLLWFFLLILTIRTFSLSCPLHHFGNKYPLHSDRSLDLMRMPHLSHRHASPRLLLR